MGKTVKVKQGETLISIAHAHQVFDWQRIWNHENNRALRAVRPNPQVLYENDQVYIPDHKDSIKRVDVSTGRAHVFQLKKLPYYFSVYLKDEGGAPFAGCRYRLVIEGQTYEGTTSSEGLVCHPVEPTARKGELKLWLNSARPEETFTWSVQVGYLNPVTTLSGLKGRLKNLGYETGPLNEEMDDLTRAALRNFQRHMGFDPPTGEINEATREALVRLHNDH